MKNDNTTAVISAGEGRTEEEIIYNEFSLIGIEIALKNQSIGEKDRFDGEILICGECGLPRREYRKLPMSDGSARSVLCPCDCPCDTRRKKLNEERERAEQREKRLKRLRAYSMMEPRQRKCSFENAEINDQNRSVLDACSRYAHKFDSMFENNYGLLLWGNVGTGKTFAAACVANYLIEKKLSTAVMLSFSKAVEGMRSGVYTEDELIDKVTKTRLLVLDDLGAERSTGYALEKVYNIIDSRYNAGKPMIITTNLALPDMKSEPDPRYSRIYDRIFECCFPLAMNGVSFRRKQGNEMFRQAKLLLSE